jgi:hypothetical protein
MLGAVGFAVARIVVGAPWYALFALAMGCTSTTNAAPADGGARDAGAAGDGAGADAPDDGDAPLAVTMAATVAPGSDVYRCKYVAMPPVAAGATAFFVGATHAYGAGAHHVLVFRTDLTAVPPGQDAERDCATPDDVMPHARAQIYGAQAKTGAFAMPDGVGLPLAAGEVLLVQVHYLNATASALDAQVSLSLRTRLAGITQRAGAFFFADPFVDVGPAQQGRAAMRCAIPHDATLLAVSGYAHARAIDFSAFVDPAAGPKATSPFYRAPGSANPLPLQGNVPVAAGNAVRFACTFDNTRGTTEVLGGPRSDADEACVLSGLYVPELGADVDACRTAPGGFGTGAATCAQARTCTGACPVGSAPPADLGLGSGAAADPCWQRCVVASCSDASQLLFAERACLAASCASACAAGPSAACTACAQASCAKEVSACDADACP